MFLSAQQLKNSQRKFSVENEKKGKELEMRWGNLMHEIINENFNINLNYKINEKTKSTYLVS